MFLLWMKYCHILISTVFGCFLSLQICLRLLLVTLLKMFYRLILQETTFQAKLLQLSTFCT